MRNVVELGCGPIDEFQAIGAKRPQRAPVVEIERKVGLGIERLTAPIGAKEVATVEPRGIERPQSAEHRRHHVSQAHRIGRCAHAPRDARTCEDERHAERRVVQQDSVRRFAMLAERFAVIGGCDDERLLGPERVQQPADLIVRVRDLAVVRRRRESRSKRFGRLVRVMRVEDVHP